MKKRLLSVLSMLLSITMLFSAGAVNVYAVNGREEATQQSSVLSSNGFAGVLENERFSLYYRESDANIALLNKNTGYIWYSNPQTLDEFSTGTKIKSQLAFQYYKNDTYLEVMDNYDYGIEDGNVPKYEVEDGVLTLSFEIGDTGFSNEMLPPVILRKTMEKEILSKLDEVDQATILGGVNKKYILYSKKELDKETYESIKHNFPIIDKHDIYVFNTSTPPYIAENVYKAFKKAGYNEEKDIERYSKETGVKAEFKEKPFFNAELKLSLNDNGLNVKLDPEDVEYSKDYKPVSVEILPYFGATFKDTDGYMLVPDGSGAVIEFNNGKTNVSTYNKPIYETDNSANAPESKGNIQLTSLPFFGIASKNGSFIASIDSGYEAASVLAEVSGSNTSFNKISTRYELFKSEFITFSMNSLDTVLKFAEDIFSSTISVDYIFTDSYATYSELAGIYRNHLIDNGVLKERKITHNDMNISFMGTTEVTKSFLGIPYKYMDAYTTLKNAEKILDKISVKKVDVRLIDFTEGGSSPKNVTSLKLQKSVGKIKNLSDLYDNTSTAYLSVFSQYQSSAKKRESAVALSAEVAYRLYYSLVNRKKETQKYSYLLSASLLDGYSKKIVKQASKYDVEAINLRDIGYELNRDLREGSELDRSEVRKLSQKYMSNLSKEVTLSVDKGSIFALPYVSKIWDIPMGSSNYFTEDYAVPFYQMVISGYVSYVTPAINEGSETVYEFLKCVEYGAEPQFTLTYKDLDNVNFYREDYYAYNYDNYIDTIKDMADKYSDVRDAVQSSYIVKHESFDGDTAVTEYANGVKLYVNYTDSQKTVQGHKVPAQDLLIIK